MVILVRMNGCEMRTARVALQVTALGFCAHPLSLQQEEDQDVVVTNYRLGKEIDGVLALAGVVLHGALNQVFCFFKQKTAYEIPKRDWSSAVCSSDLRPAPARQRHRSSSVV